MYPPIEPYERGMLPVGDGHLIYYELCGNPEGQAAVVLHGGPGSGCTDFFRRLFDPLRYRVVLFDQRNCGRSTPHASDINVDLQTNTTHRLIEDIERLRHHLAVDKWLLYGGSWGTTLGLAYAQEYPRHVHALVLSAVTTTRRSEIEWLYRGVAPLFPAAWQRFRSGVPAPQRDGDLVKAYHALLENRDPAIHRKAARDWCNWEAAILSADQEAQPYGRYEDPAFQLTFARIVTHYFAHNAWLEDGILLRNAGKLADIPGILVHGRLDLVAPLTTAWELRHAWPGSKLIIVDQEGHDSSGSGMVDAIVDATDQLA